MLGVKVAKVSQTDDGVREDVDLTDKRRNYDLKLTYTELRLMYEAARHRMHELYDPTRVADNYDFGIYMKIRDSCEELLDHIVPTANIPFYAEVFTLNLHAGALVRISIPFRNDYYFNRDDTYLRHSQQCTRQRLLKKINWALHKLEWGHY